jgi:hypothetical protein
LSLGLGEGESIDELFEQLLTRGKQLWIAHDGKNVSAAAATEIVTLGKRKVCNILTIGGKLPDDWEAHLKIMESWAKSKGCSAMRFPGIRLGWERVLKNYKVKKILMEKEL